MSRTDGEGFYARNLCSNNVHDMFITFGRLATWWR